ncbi:MAG: hypothetical protein CVU80_00565 [Elusimicrobia bacterium HGW-Elusimicrobia-4]|nr:MAG: hypothetical protein CVU80_00565 [Elusimicrobia bacterium HGW-Elusimicrobia-4]
MLKNKKHLPCIILIALLLCITAHANTDSSRIDKFENELKEQQKEYREGKKEEKEKPLTIEPFCRNLSQNVTWWQMTAEEIQKIKNNGLGHSELIKVILISKKIEKSPDEIVKKRNRGDTFLKISERYGLDYGQIKNETKKIMAEVKTYGTK